MHHRCRRAIAGQGGISSGTVERCGKMLIFKEYFKHPFIYLLPELQYITLQHPISVNDCSTESIQNQKKVLQ